MSEATLLFPYIDVAMRVVAVLILCALPILLMPLPPPVAALRYKPRAKAVVTND